jgi:hypothetical protein
MLVQPLLRNHSSLCVRNNATLEPARLVTGRLLDGTVSPIYGAFYFDRDGRSGQIKDRAALVDVSSGELIGEALNGRRTLPDWPNAVRGALAAHIACADFAFVGWDIALTDEGSVLLEGNANWCADEFQALSGQPLGNTVFSDILTNRLQGLPRLRRRESHGKLQMI